MEHKELEQIKKSLLGQLDKFPEDQRASIKENLEKMSDQEFVEFLKENELLGKCIFCSIAKGETNSFKIGENKDNLAILEINPKSYGHTMIVPKEHLEKTLPESSMALAKEITAILAEKLNPKKVNIAKNQIMGHLLLELIPDYGEKSTKKKATETELLELQKLLKEPAKKIAKEKEASEPVKEKPRKIKPRIP